MYKPLKPFILASSSPRRQEILSSLGYSFLTISPDIDETYHQQAPETFVQELSEEKAKAGFEMVQSLSLDAFDRLQQFGRPCQEQVKRLRQSPVILAADTIVVSPEGEVFGKPESQQDYNQMLTQLSGRWHQTLTAVSLFYGQRLQSKLSVTQVQMVEISPEMMAAYWNSDEPKGKAGGYGIQGLASLMIRQIQGSYSGVMGMPIYESGTLLDEVGIQPLSMQ